VEVSGADWAPALQALEGYARAQQARKAGGLGNCAAAASTIATFASQKKSENEANMEIILENIVILFK
jgi:hypothetical protein